MDVLGLSLLVFGLFYWVYVGNFFLHPMFSIYTPIYFITPSLSLGTLLEAKATPPLSLLVERYGDAAAMTYSGLEIFVRNGWNRGNEFFQNSSTKV